MLLKSISLVNYKNFDSQSFEFNQKVNCFVGPNGIGKTNILDAIYHLSFGKSYFNPIATQNIKQELITLFSKKGNKSVDAGG